MEVNGTIKASQLFDFDSIYCTYNTYISPYHCEFEKNTCINET